MCQHTPKQYCSGRTNYYKRVKEAKYSQNSGLLTQPIKTRVKNAETGFGESGDDAR